MSTIRTIIETTFNRDSRTILTTITTYKRSMGVGVVIGLLLGVLLTLFVAASAFLTYVLAGMWNIDSIPYLMMLFLFSMVAVAFGLLIAMIYILWMFVTTILIPFAAIAIGLLIKPAVVLGFSFLYAVVLDAVEDLAARERVVINFALSFVFLASSAIMPESYFTYVVAAGSIAFMIFAFKAVIDAVKE